MPSGDQSYAYCTLITRSTYLAGVIILAHTLTKHKSAHPLIVLYTDTLPESSIRALELEAPKTNLILRKVTALLPRKNIHVHLIAERFADTWTKLRVFQLHESDPQFKTICYLDADMTIRQNMDQVFGATNLPADDWIAANHACVCNLDHDQWAPEDWTKENCAYTPISHPEALTRPTPVTSDSRGTYHLLNSGMFVFRPSIKLWDEMLNFFNTSPLLGEFKFPDQDFLAEFFKNRWISLSWRFNALKTMRYWHKNIWRDNEVVCLHYIVDKPWAKRVAEDGTAGYLRRDGVTHTWWWEDFEEWRDARMKDGDEEILGIVSKYVDGVGMEESEEMKAIGSQVQAFAGNKKPGQEDSTGAKEREVENEAKTSQEAAANDQENGSVGSNHLRQKVLGERGHGARLRGGSSQMPP